MSRILATLLALLLAGPAFAQSAGTLNLLGPSSTPPAPQILRVDQLNGAINAALTAKADVANPVFTGTLTAPTGAFTTLTASASVSGVGFTALLAPYAPLASPTFTGTINGAALALTGAGSFGSGTFGVGSGGSGTGLVVNNAAQAKWLNTSSTSFTIAGAITPLLFTQSNFAGSLTASALADINRMAISADTMDCSIAQENSCKGLDIVWNLSGAARGGRHGVRVAMNPVSLTNVMSVVAGRFTIGASTAMGGSLFQPLTTNTNLNAGASGVGGMGNEFDYGVSAGAAAPSSKAGLAIVLNSGDAVAAPIDGGLFFSNSNLAGVSPGMGSAIWLGNTSQAWPINPTTGSVLGINLQTANQGNARNGQFVPTSGFTGIDLQYENVSLVSGYSFRGAGFATDGGGQGTFGGGLLLGTTATGYKIDVPNKQVVTAVAVTVAGSPSVSVGLSTANYYPGDIVYGAGAPSVGQYQVATTKIVSAAVSSGGSGGTNGTQTVTGTTGTGTPFQASVTVAGNAITAVLSITVAGNYTVNPTNLNVEPVTGAGLTGAALAVGVGALTVTVLVPDVYAACPGAAFSPLGGSGIGLTITPTCTARSTIQLNPSGGAIQAGSGAFTANGAIATTMTSLGPTGSHTTVQEWFTVTDAGGTVRYIPAY